MTLGAFISSGTAGFVAAKLGRKICLWLACLLCVVSNVIMMATTDIGALYAGRFLIGLANGYFMTFSQLYIQESSPAKYRGLFLAVFQFCVSMVSAAPVRDCNILTLNGRAGHFDRNYRRLGYRQEARQVRISHSLGHHLRSTHRSKYRLAFST